VRHGVDSFAAARAREWIRDVLHSLAPMATWDVQVVTYRLIPTGHQRTVKIPVLGKGVFRAQSLLQPKPAVGDRRFKDASLESKLAWHVTAA
jgi:hypothetical protein